ncbi:MAG TPA: copper resistance CopC family protein [Actinoplanes sp.]|nr:copper resistance CopC family protein [Actinoplanes sp.]
MLLVLVPGAPAWAHNALAEASPDKKATVKEAPAEVKLRFLQKLDPEYTVIALTDSTKRKVATSEPKVEGPTGVITIEEALANGVYTVAYQVVSTDGHTVKGSYEFTVADPSAAPSPSPSATTTAPETAQATTAPALAESSGESDDSGSTVIGVVAGIVVVLAAVAGFLFLRRRKA